MVRQNNENGSVNISTNVFVDIAGTAATNCMGVKGMVARSITDGVYHLLRKESMGKLIHILKRISVSTKKLIDYASVPYPLCSAVEKM